MYERQNSTGATTADITHHKDLLIGGIISLVVAILGASGISYAFYRSIKQVRIRSHVIHPELAQMSRWLTTHGACNCQVDSLRTQRLNPTAPAVNTIFPDDSQVTEQTYS